MTIPVSGSSAERFGSVEEYMKARSALVEAERAQGFDGDAKPTALEERASEVLNALKVQEEGSLHTVHPNGTGFERAHRYLHGLDTIANSKVLDVARKAPKGALLHCHLDAMLPPQLLLEDARKQQNLYIKTDAPLVSKGFFAHTLPEFTVLGENVEVSAVNNCFSAQYVSGSWMKYSEFLKAFPGGSAKAEEWICSKIVLSAGDAYHPEQTVDGIWMSFKRAFMVLRGLTGYVTAYRNHFERVIWQFARDGIHYAEIRVPLRDGYFIASDDGKENLSHKEMIGILADVLASELPKIRAKGLIFYGTKFIYGSMRSSTREQMQWAIDDCIELKQAYPDLICGFDMQGQEDDGHSHLHWIPELLAMRARCDALGLDLPFIFHAGETLDHGGATDSNLYDAILLGTKRIGHGFSLTKHPLLMQLCKERKIAVEACPISNEVLGLCPTVRNHPLPVLLAHCVPCTVNSDDPGCWESTLSHDFYQTLVGSERMSLVGWRVLVEWSFEYSCVGDGERQEWLRVFRTKWDEFCRWVVDTYGEVLKKA
ncbi:Metallo-dependent hydrolase [Saccharata proteae CBS 121410]|uniref:adenosine deaminase n=1 Tax=Saccharata proteae CBS 121410 TaxID=1314787 RepID=A0A9P4I216_9PEZI|nr:Metallo-dependent hydrolase [Saccharata proteae CBS 121410]